MSFGTSGHRGSPFRGSFTEAHIAAITQAICDHRHAQRIDGPLYIGKDTHALSEPAQRTALAVLAANGVETIIQRGGGVAPTPVISWAILRYNRGRKAHLADGIVVTPSHNPPEDGGYKLDIAVVNPAIDPTFSFMTVDHDGKIRMDPSSPYAMARLVELRDRFRVAFANNPDSDRHGIVMRSAGLMKPNQYLAVAIRYLLPIAPTGRRTSRRRKLGRRLYEVPVGFKCFVPGLFDGSCCFGGEESAGASFLRHDGSVWTIHAQVPTNVDRVNRAASAGHRKEHQR